MSPDFRKSTNNTNSKQGGVNPSPSFQDRDKAKSLIEKNLREGYADYSKDEEPISRAVQEIVRDGDFSPEAIKRKANQIKLEETNKLKSKYPGVFEDGDFSSDNIEKPSSGTIDTATQRTFRDLKNEIAKEGDIISVEAINELAGLEYFSKHLEELKEKAKMGEIAERKAEEEKTLPALSSAPHIPLGALPHASAPHRAPMPSPASHTFSPSIPSPKISHISSSSPQAPRPSQGGGNQGGGMSIKSGVSSFTPTVKSSSPTHTAPAFASPASSAPVHIAPSAHASQTPQNADESIAPASAPASTPASAVSPQTADEPASTPMPSPKTSLANTASAPATSSSKASPASQTTSEPASTPAPAPASSAQPQASSSKVLPSRSSEKQPMNNQGEEAPVKQTSQASPAPSQAISESAQPEPQSQPEPEPVLTHTPTSSLAAAPSASSHQAYPAKTLSSSQGSTESSMDNAQEENDEGMSKETIEEIKEKVKKQLEDSLGKNVDNGMGGVAIQDGAGKSDADKIKTIKALAEQKNLNDQRNRISLINSAIKMDSARVDPADREAEAQRIRKEAEEKAEEEIRKEIGGVKGKIASKVLSKVMGLAAYKIAQELSQKANKGKHQVALVVIITLVLAILADFIDIARDSISIASAATVVGLIVAIAVWLLLLLASSLLTTTISMFWMILAGGGHSKLMWRFFIKTVLAISFNAVPFFGDIPFTVIIVLWNWYDFAKERRKAKQEFKAFVAKNKSLLKNVSAS